MSTPDSTVSTEHEEYYVPESSGMALSATFGLMLTLVGGLAYLLVILIEIRVLHYLPKRPLGGF